jgi:glutamate-ammonia-ligase adenylyltransferase
MTGFAGKTWPVPADMQAAAALAERLSERGRPFAALVRKHPAMIAAVGGNSPYLSELVLREAACLRQMLVAGPEAVTAAALARITDTPAGAPRARIAATLRQAKRQVALITGLADIAGAWDLAHVTAALSDLAERALQLAVAHLLHEAGRAGELRPGPGQPSGFTVLGMGKLGARELNYSSDVDLILLYDPDAHPYHADRLGACFSRMARGLVALMETRDADGYVFRTDLRLRPDPAATPPAIALPAALTYYESMGQNWERAALLKARPVAGDLGLGEAFLGAIRPFIWRKHLDFAAVADIHAMKQRINRHRGQREPSGDSIARIAGYNLKLGRGGIREIEFLAQTLQLVWGGREPGLRVPTTIGALQVLTRAGHLPARAAGELAAAYRFLRTAEHRLQMVADRQTHTLPDTPAGLAAFAGFLGFPDAASLAETLLRHLGRVQARYAQVFESVPSAPDLGYALDFRGAKDNPTTLAALAALGFTQAPVIVASVRGWRAGRLRALRSERARELLDSVLPLLLAALARQTNPDAAFARLDALFARLPAGVQVLSLFQRNPALIERVAAVLGAAPSLADHLASVPAALEGLLTQEVPPKPSRLLSERLADARSLEDSVEVISRVVRGEEFRISVATLEGRFDADAAGVARATLAEAALAALLPRVLAEHTRRYGTVSGGAMAVVALGKAGGREMMAGSDLDLMLIYDHPANVDESRPPPGSTGRRLGAGEWYIRAAQAYIGALTLRGPLGALYAVDMRLRPSGNQGPVAVSLRSFQTYHIDSAWTWERMALTRARVVAGPPALVSRLRAAIVEAIGHAGGAGRIRTDAAEMRARLARDLPPTGAWDVKLRPGGQMEVEFIAQTLQLCHARKYPGVLNQSTGIALRRLADAGLLDQDDATMLIGADHFWRSVQGMLRITLGRGTDFDPFPEPVLHALARATGQATVDLPDFRAKLELIADQVRAAFVRIVGKLNDPPEKEPTG